MSRSTVRLSMAASALALLACSPALDWRSVPLPEAGITLSLPCKPERAARPVDLGAGEVELSMVGCRADGATFALSHMPLADPSQAGAALARWRTAVLARMQAGPQAQAQAGAAFVPRQALDLPQSLRMVVRGRGADGAEVVAETVWFARLEGLQARLYHAVVYAPQPRTAAADTFFTGLALQQ
ncbi:hypothetical protein [Alicycliphilus denitrificans]|uniref:hypothetical protein n=1 Tax=Alicycliphilus denitrificans TaxID=179636 RepID=UPI0016019CCD|nr:hypothetical protein [Alicycliphilus denitrificans]